MDTPTIFVDVIVPLGVPKMFTYRAPRDMEKDCEQGRRVLVQFGKSKLYTGIIYSVHHKAPEEYNAKYLEAVLDEHPVLSPLQLRFWDWISFYYLASPGEVMNAALPAGLKLSSTSHVQLHPEFNFEESSGSDFTAREHQVLDALYAQPGLSFEALAELLKLKSVHALVNKLLRKKALLVYEDVKERYKPKLITVFRLNAIYHDEEKLKTLIKTLEKKAFKQVEILFHYLKDQARLAGPGGEFHWLKSKDLKVEKGDAAIKTLVKKGVFEQKDTEVDRLLYESATEQIKALSALQTKALHEIKSGFDAKRPVLFSGVTGSGKTEIYIHLIREALERGEQVLYLLPEIALTTQLITRLRAVFGEAVGVYHSRFSEHERVEIWTKVLNWPSEEPVHTNFKTYQVILGARSALLLPFHKLGLIIVDEEHDSSFKQRDPSPRYHARDSALYLATLHKARVLLGSATPSVESLYNVSQNKYSLVELKEQYVKGGGTTIELCDMNYFRQSRQMKGSFSGALVSAMTDALEKKQQIILFQNRRGFAPYTECRDCGHVPHCVQCDVSLIYHKQNDKLNCHYCGYTVSPPKSCSACGSEHLQYKGLGTEKIEEDVEILFPGARIARMDLDSTRSKYAYKQLIDDFENHQIDILIGTQMVTKGLDFNNVSLVGILDADALMNFPDFRSFERAYQLITQVRGRAGRAHTKGRVLVQTSQPSHKVLQHVLNNTQNDFYNEVMAERSQFHYPPYSRLIGLSVITADKDEATHLSETLYKLLEPAFKGRLLGPEFPVVAKIRNQYHKNLLIKMDRSEKAGKTRELLQNALEDLRYGHKNWKYRVAVVVDPV